MGEGWRLTPEASILFSFGTDFTWRVKAGHQIETWQRRSAAGRADSPASSSEPCTAAATASAHHHCRFLRSLPPTQNVVETFGVPLLKTKPFLTSDLLNCEGSVKSARNPLIGVKERTSSLI